MCRILFLIFLCSIKTFGQTPRDDYDNAAKAYEGHNFSSALSYLQSTITKLKITNPKIESLKALCFYAQEDYVNAKIAMNKYFKMVAATQSASENHQSLLIVNSKIDEKLQEEELNFEKTLQKKRLEKASQIDREAKQNLAEQLLKKIETADTKMAAIYNNTNDKWAYNEAINNSSAKRNGKITVKEGNYSGEYVGEKTRHGTGIMEYINEPIYKGVWRYTGQWKNDRRHGEGTIKNVPYKKGDVIGANGGIPEETYTGTWVNDVLQGMGKYEKQASFKYEGNFINGKMEGQGIAIYTTYGQKYKGEWKNGVREGFGIYSRLEDGGDTYTGEWKNDREDGKGTFISKEMGIIQDGQWKNGSLNGYAIYKRNNGESYEGYWVKGKMEGKGTFVYKNGEKYVGDWKQDNKEGYGTYIWPNGNRYEGNWHYGLRSEQGTMTYQNGEKYVGEWRVGKMQGNGTLYDKNNTVIQKGKWFDDKYVDPVSLIKPARLYAKDVMAKYTVISKDTNHLICYSLVRDSISLYFYTTDSYDKPTIYFDVNDNNEVDTLVDRFSRNFRDKLQTFYIKGGAAPTKRIWNYENNLITITYPITEITKSNVVAFQVAYKNWDEENKTEIFLPSRKEKIDFRKKKLFYINIP